MSEKGIQSHTLDDVLRGIAQVEASIEQLEERTAVDEKLCQQEEPVLNERRELTAALQEILRVRSSDAGGEPATGRVRKLEEAAAMLQQTNKSLMGQLSQFLDRYYPSSGEGTGVKELLQDLMNRAVTRPDEPWLVLTDSVRNENVELLLRAGIAVKDETDTRKVRLEKFY